MSIYHDDLEGSGRHGPPKFILARRYWTHTCIRQCTYKIQRSIEDGHCHSCH